MNRKETIDRRHEIKEYLPFQGRRVLITDGTSGTGEVTAFQLQKLGATVIIGTRNTQNYERTASGLNPANTHPFILDFKKTTTIKSAMTNLMPHPTDIIHSAAVGMDGIFDRAMIDGFIRLQKIKDPDVRNKTLEQIRQTIKQKVEDNMEDARKVNFEGPKALFTFLFDTKIIDGVKKIVFFSSFWSSIYGQEGVNVPQFYKGIASTQSLLERWLTVYADSFRRKGIRIAIISGHLIKDTVVGNDINKYILPLCTPEDQKTLRESFIATSDMINATKQVLLESPKKWKEHPRKLYITGRGITTSISPSDPVFQVKLPI